MARSYHGTVLFGKRGQAFRRATYREGGGCLLMDDQCTKNRLTGCRGPWGEAPRHAFPPPWKTPCAPPSRIIGKYPNRYPSTSWRMTSRG